MTSVLVNLTSRGDRASASLEARLVAFRPQVQRHILAMVRDKSEAEELIAALARRAV